MTWREYFLYAKKIKITTFFSTICFNFSVSSRQNSAILDITHWTHAAYALLHPPQCKDALFSFKPKHKRHEISRLALYLSRRCQWNSCWHLIPCIFLISPSSSPAMRAELFFSQHHEPEEMRSLILFMCLFLFLSLSLQAVRMRKMSISGFCPDLFTRSCWMRDAAVAFESELRMGQIDSFMFVWLTTLSTLLMTVFKCTLSSYSQTVMSNVGHAVHLASLNISGEILEHSHCLISLKGNQRTLLFHNGNISWNWSHVRTKAFQSLKVLFSVLVPTVFAFLLPILHSIFRNLVY